MLVSITNAKQGMALDGDLISDNNEKILASGTLLTDAIISLLESKGFDSINLSVSEEEKKKWGLNENFVNPTVNKKITDSAKKVLTTLMTQTEQERLDNESLQKITHAAELISSKILASDKTLCYDINDYVNDKDLVSQSARIATYATALAKGYNNRLASANMTSRINLEEIATAGLLVNYGSICTNEEIRKRINYYIPLKDTFPGLTEDKIKELKINYNPEYVSYYSYNLLRESDLLSSFIKTAITLSSENDKENGPLQAKQFSGELSNKSATIVAAKMLSISKKVDEILSKNIDKTGDLSSSETALKELFESGEYSQELIDLFINTVPLYPVGTKVELKGVHNGAAVVVDNHKDINTWHRPTVKCLDNDEEVDLRIENSTEIANIIGHDIEVKEKNEVIPPKVEEVVPVAEAPETVPVVEAPVESAEEVKAEEPAPVVVEETQTVGAPTPVVETPVVTENNDASAESPVTSTEEVKPEEPAPVVVEETQNVVEPTRVVEDIVPNEAIDPIGQNNTVSVENSPSVTNSVPQPEQQPIELVSGPANIFGNNNYVPEEQIMLNSGPADIFGYSNFQPEEQEESMGMRM